MTAVTLIGALVSQVTMAAADCRCRGSNGTLFQQGELACIKTAKGPRLARCGMILNNSSWTVVRDDCPTAMATPLADAMPIGRIATRAAPAAEPISPHAGFH
jgi:hypothetical protein